MFVLFRNEAGHEPQKNMGQLLAHLGDGCGPMRLELGLDGVEVVLVDLVAGAFRAAGWIAALTGLERPASLFFRCINSGGIALSG
jgi:hypothetical protein